jgi:hypothetical protein
MSEDALRRVAEALTPRAAEIMLSLGEYSFSSMIDSAIVNSRIKFLSTEDGSLRRSREFIFRSENNGGEKLKTVLLGLNFYYEISESNSHQLRLFLFSNLTSMVLGEGGNFGCSSLDLGGGAYLTRKLTDKVALMVILYGNYNNILGNVGFSLDDSLEYLLFSIGQGKNFGFTLGTSYNASPRGRLVSNLKPAIYVSYLKSTLATDSIPYYRRTSSSKIYGNGSGSLEKEIGSHFISLILNTSGEVSIGKRLTANFSVGYDQSLRLGGSGGGLSSFRDHLRLGVGFRRKFESTMLVDFGYRVGVLSFGRQPKAHDEFSISVNYLIK